MPWDPDVKQYKPYYDPPGSSPMDPPPPPGYGKPGPKRNYGTPAPPGGTRSPETSSGGYYGNPGYGGLGALAQGGEVGDDVNYKTMKQLQQNPLQNVLSLLHQDGSKGDYDDANVVIPLGSHNGYIVRLGSMQTDLYKLSGSEIKMIQQLLYVAGFYGEEYYSNNLPPDYGNIAEQDKDGKPALLGALASFMTMALRDGKTGMQTLDERTAWNADRIRRINEATGGAASGGASNLYVDNPFRVIPITNATTLEAAADKVAQDVFGRKATADEKAKFVSMFQGRERLIGQQAVDVSQQNAFTSGQTAQLNSGGGDGQKQGYGALVGQGPTGSASGAAVFPVGGLSAANLGPNTYMQIWKSPGSKPGHRHHGTDISAPRGTPILSAVPGVVTQVNHGPNGVGGGNTVTVRGDDGRFYSYLHMDQTMASVGQHVGAGNQIGTVGDTGNAKGRGTHLHFMISADGHESSSMDPFPFLKGTEGGNKVGTAAETVGSVGPQTDAGGVVYTTFAADVLKGIGAPVNQENMAVMVAWMRKEGGGRGDSHYKNNPLNTGMGKNDPNRFPGAQYIGSHNLGSYASYDQGVAATVATLKLGYYTSMLQAFQGGHGAAAIPHMAEHWCPAHECPGYVDAVSALYRKALGEKMPTSGSGQGVDFKDVQGGVFGEDQHGNSIFQETAADPTEEADKMFRKLHPDEAGAGDISDQYKSFVGLLMGGSRGGIGGTAG